MLKNNKIKKRNSGSHNVKARKTKKGKLNLFSTTDDQKPTPSFSPKGNPGRAILTFIPASFFNFD